MHRTVSVLFGALVALSGCTGSPIGDPCVPESIPPGGFDQLETYLETSSVQCRTRTCMVYNLEGDPADLCPTDDAPGCKAVRDQIFCTCRCSIPEGGEANTPLCACPQGYQCQEDLVTTGGPGVMGGYCVPCTYSGDPRNLDPAVFRTECGAE